MGLKLGWLLDGHSLSLWSIVHAYNSYTQSKFCVQSSEGVIIMSFPATGSGLCSSISPLLWVTVRFTQLVSRSLTPSRSLVSRKMHLPLLSTPAGHFHSFSTISVPRYYLSHTWPWTPLFPTLSFLYQVSSHQLPPKKTLIPLLRNNGASLPTPTWDFPLV